MKRTTMTYPLGHTSVTFISDRYAGEYLDTEVKIGDETLLTVAGNERNEFLEKLRELVETYRI